MKSYHKHGGWNVICDVCGFKFKSNEVKLRWDGLYVCSDDWEPRHPSDLIRIPAEHTNVPYVRDDPSTASYIVCNLYNAQGVAGLAVAGCARAGDKLP